LQPTVISGLVLALVLSSRTASGDPLSVRSAGTLPFSDAELDSALAVRAALAPAGTPSRLIADVNGDATAAKVTVLGRERIVALDGQSGGDAARLVAFAILELAGDQLDPPAGATGAELVPLAPAVDVVAPIHRAQPSVGAPRWTAGVWAAAGTRDDIAFELGVPIVRAVRALVSIGIDRTATATAMAETVELRDVPARVGVAYRAAVTRFGALELRATALAVIESASAARSQSELRWGGGGAVVWAVPVLARGAGGVTAQLGFGVDGFVSAIDYQVDGHSIVTTDRVAWWGGVGVAAELWR